MQNNSNIHPGEGRAARTADVSHAPFRKQQIDEDLQEAIRRRSIPQRTSPRFQRDLVRGSGHLRRHDRLEALDALQQPLDDAVGRGSRFASDVTVDFLPTYSLRQHVSLHVRIRGNVRRFHHSESTIHLRREEPQLLAHS